MPPFRGGWEGGRSLGHGYDTGAYVCMCDWCYGVIKDVGRVWYKIVGLTEWLAVWIDRVISIKLNAKIFYSRASSSKNFFLETALSNIYTSL